MDQDAPWKELSAASREAKQGPIASFTGYPPPTSNTTYTPNQFFDLVLPHFSRGVVRLVGHMIRRVHGFSKPDGTPQEEQVSVSYGALVDRAGISRGAIRATIDEAIEGRLIRCVSAGIRDSRHQIGASSFFELNYAEDDKYITDPELFQGFYPSNGNLTHIPNAFFDYTIPNESLSLVQVVGAVIRHSIGFQTKYGFRRQHVALSFNDLLRITRIKSKGTINLAIQEAIRKNHISCLEAGVFSGDREKRSKTTYSPRWASAVPEGASIPQDPTTLVHLDFAKSSPTKASVQTSEQGLKKGRARGLVQKSDQQNSGLFDGTSSKIGPRKQGGLVQKSDQQLVQKSDQDQFKNRTNIEITNLNNKEKQQQQQTPSRDAASPAAAVFVPSFERLKAIGFDPAAAHELSQEHSPEVIENQIVWFPRRQRNSVRNPLGLLRRAIEENWAEPQDGSPKASGGLGEVFARHYYAGYHGQSGEPVTEPFASDITAAQAFLQKSGIATDLENAREAGKTFGKLVRSKHGFKHDSKPYLASALTLFGGEFVVRRQKQARASATTPPKIAPEAGHHEIQPEYIAYLREQQKSLQRRNAGLYDEFLKEHKKALKEAQKFNLKPETIAKMASEEATLFAFAEFCAARNSALLSHSAWAATRTNQKGGNE